MVPLLRPNQRTGGIMSQHFPPSLVVFYRVEVRNTGPQPLLPTLMRPLSQSFTFFLAQMPELLVSAQRRVIFQPVDLSLVMLVQYLVDGLPDMSLLVLN